MKKRLIKYVKSQFHNYFKAIPLLVFASGRINLIGEHTDYNDGLMFPAAINKEIVVALSISDSDFSKVLKKSFSNEKPLLAQLTLNN